MQTKVTADPQLQNDGATLKHRKSQNKDKYKAARVKAKNAAAKSKNTAKKTF